jgi:hypothetical protein
VDEVGSNTLQSKDGRVRGQNYLCSIDGRPQQCASTKDAHFTVLGFTAASREPVMCAIIFAGKVMRDDWKTGFDPLVQWIGDPDNIEENTGDGKQYPMGPTCFFKGKEIPCFCCCSDSGTITANLLTEMLQLIDSLNIYNLSTGPNPFLILDGHGSHFEPEFLEYINTCKAKWCVNIGLPYGTSYWQVGDSSEQNGCFIMALTKCKQALVTAKNDANLPYEINQTDVVKLVKDAWKDSFARVESNKKAILHRGWGPKELIYNVLLHPEIASSNPNKNGEGNEVKRKQKTFSTSVTASKLNLNEGLAGTLIDWIVLESNKSAKLKGNTITEITSKRHAMARQSLENHEKHCTVGLIGSGGMFALNHEILAYARHTKEVQDAKLREKQIKAKDAYDALRAKVEAVKLIWSEVGKSTCIGLP